MPLDDIRAVRARCDLCGWVGKIRFGTRCHTEAYDDLDEHFRGRMYCPEEDTLLPVAPKEGTDDEQA